MSHKIKFLALAGVMLSMCLTTAASAQSYTAAALGDYGNVSVMEVTGNYDIKNQDGSSNSGPRQAVAKEFFRTHKDEYDFIVIFTNFDFKMVEFGDKGVYHGIKNDVHGIGLEIFNNSPSGEYGSSGNLQGIIDMGNLANISADQASPEFTETLNTLGHELMHRWGSHARFRNADGSENTALLGMDQEHWSFLLDTAGSVMYGNRWQDNGNGTFTSTTPYREMKLYSPLDLYLMGMIDRSKVPPMLLIDSPGADPARLPEAGVTITGTARMVTIDDIIAAMGPRVPDASASQKSFKTAFIYITQPGTFNADAIYQIENIRNGFVTRHSILTDGRSIVQVAPTTKDDLPVNPGVLPPSTTPRTSPANISEGVQWLQANQKSDGSWADLPQTEERDTAQAVLVIKNFLDAQTNYGYGLQRLGLVASGNTDFLCRKIEAYATAQQNTSDLLTELLARRNSDGGWGSDRMYQSNPADTGLALKALALAGYGDQGIIAPAISYLTARQNSNDGGWGPDDNGSTLQFTAAVLAAFNKYRGSYQLEDRINRGMELIESRQNSLDKGFGNSPSTVYDTATAVLALRELGAPTNITNDGLDYIRGQQGGDGSWNGSAFQTAMAIDAIYKATVDPDLAVKTSDISFIPATITSLPANVVINANVWNLGQTAVPQAVVALYKDSVIEANRIADQIISFPGQQATAVTFSTNISSDNEHRFFLVVDPENLVKESGKANNSAIAVIAVESTYDLEALSQDITLSGNPVDMSQDVTITAKITNRGTMNAYNAQVKYFIDDPANPFIIATSTINVPAGAKVTDSVTWRASKAGVNMPLAVMADPVNNFTELSETNNKAAATITVNADARPNITVSHKDIVVTPSPAKQGGNVSISALVKNEGFSASNEVNVAVWSAATGTIGSQTIAALAPGESMQVIADWTNIPVSGTQTIYVGTVSAGPEIRTNDNEAFITLNILSLPDLTISTNSIAFSPAFPKESDIVTIVATIQNEGEQGAQNVVVNAFEGGTLVGTTTIASIPGLLASSATFTYNTTGRQGAHEITVIIDPENSITEQNRANNRAARSFGVQNANLWVTEQYFSPNGDGVKDSTRLFIRFETSRTVTIRVVNQKGETVRTFSGTGLQNVDSASIEWNGLNDGGTLVDDGSYRIELIGETDKPLGSVVVTVDTNRSPLEDAIGTKYLLNNNLTCMLPNLASWDWLPAESGIAFSIDYSDYIALEYTNGVYTMSPNGEDIIRLTPEEWTDLNPDDSYSWYQQYVSPTGDRIAFTFWKYRYATGEYTNELWVVGRDGKHLAQISTVVNNYNLEQIHAIQWSPDGEHISYIARSTTNNVTSFILYVYNVSTHTNKYIDSDAWYYEVWESQWSPNGKRLAYQAGECNANSKCVKITDADGTITGIFDKTGLIRWLANGRILLESYNWSYGAEYWTIDSSGNNDHRQTDVSSMSDIVVAPDKRSFVFTVEEENERLLHISDSTGNVTLLHSTAIPPLCVLASANVVWTKDSKTIAFFEEGNYRYSEAPVPCSEAVGPNLIVVDLSTLTKKTVALPQGGISLINWLANDRTILAAGSPNPLTIDALTGRSTILADVLPWRDEVQLSPGRQYISFNRYVDSSSACRERGYIDLWTLSSMLNLTADLRLFKERSSVNVKGIAADLNFEGYQLEYANEKAPGVWNPVAPPSNIPVVNDLFTTWVPPYEGTFLVRLTVRDRAGNTAVSMRRVSWGISSSITSLYKSLEIFSPNGIKNTVELHYRVLEPVHLEFGVYDAEGVLIRTIFKDHALPMEDFMSWDGRDEGGQVVQDGKYSIRIYDYSFFVEVDTTLPDVGILFTSPDFEITESRLSQGSLVGQVKGVFSKLLGHAVDRNFRQWSVEYGDGMNPDTWHELLSGAHQLVGKDKDGNFQMEPAKDALIQRFVSKEGGWPIESGYNKRYRITAEDFAGNKRTVLADVPHEGILSSLEDHRVAPVYVQHRTVLRDGQYEPVYDEDGKEIVETPRGNGGVYGGDASRVRYIPGLETKGPYELTIQMLINEPVVLMIMQHARYEFQASSNTYEVVWYDAVPINNPVVPQTKLLLSDADMIQGVRIRAVDATGKEYLSNELDFANVLESFKLHCTDHSSEPKATIMLREKLKKLELRADTENAGCYREKLFKSSLLPFKVYDAARGDVVPAGDPYIFAIGEEEKIVAPQYCLEMTGVGESGRVYRDFTSYPGICSDIKLKVTVDRNPSVECERKTDDTASASAAISGIASIDGTVTLEKLTYSLIGPTPDQYSTIREIDLTNGFGDADLGITFDTASLSEAKYTLKAGLAYRVVNKAGTRTENRIAYGSAVLVVDRTQPDANITNPRNTAVCPVMMPSAGGNWPGVAVEGMMSDELGIDQYYLSYGIGDNPAEWIPATIRNTAGSVTGVKGAKTVAGQLGVWDVAGLKAQECSLRLRAVDLGGNERCTIQKVTIDTVVTIDQVSVDRNVFSPVAGDSAFNTVEVVYTIGESTAVTVQIHKIISVPGSPDTLEGNPVRTLLLNEPHTGGLASVRWDGKSDALAVVDNGKYRIDVSVRDFCGNTAHRWIDVEVDKTPPAVTITSPKAGDVLGAIMEAKGTVDDPHFQSYTLYRGKGEVPVAWIPIVSNVAVVNDSLLGKWNVAAEDEGQWVLWLTATDTAGNTSEVKVPITIGVSKIIRSFDVKPHFITPNGDTKLDVANIEYEVTGAADIKIEVVDAGGNIRNTMVESKPAAGRYAREYGGQDATGKTLPDGIYAVKITATSLANPADGQMESAMLTIDTTPPAVELTRPLNNAFLPDQNVVVSGTTTDMNIAAYTVVLEGTTAVMIDQANQSRTDYSFGTLRAIAEGDHVITVRASDLGELETVKNIPFTIDRTPPAVKLDTPKNEEYYGGAFSSIASQSSSTITITGSLLEKNLDAFNLRYRLGDAAAPWHDLVTGTTVTAYPSSHSWKVGMTNGVPDVPDGIYMLSLLARDKAGLAGEATVKVIVDNTAPSVAVTVPVDGGYVKAPADIMGTADDLNMNKYTLELSEGRCETASKWAVVGSGMKPVQGGVLLPWKAIPKDGEYCLRLIAMDKSRNKAETTTNFTIDTHPPAAPSLAGTVENQADAHLTWPQSVDTDVAGYNLYRGPQKLNSSLITELGYTDQDLSEGVFSYTLKAVDNAGWESASSNEVKLRIDVTGPNSRISSPQEGGMVSGLIDIKGTAYSADDFKQYRVSIGQGAAPATWTVIRTSPLPVSYGALAQWDTFGVGAGETYAVKIDAEDLAGNVTTHQITVTVDNQPPGQPQGLTATAVVSDVTITWITGNDPDLAGYLLYRNGQLANVSGVVTGSLKPYLIAPSKTATTQYFDKSLPDGTFKYYVVAMDTAGNESAASVPVREVIIDMQAPHAVITDPVNGAAIGGKTLVKAESADQDIKSVRFDYRLATTGTWTTIGLPVKTMPFATYFDPSGMEHGMYELRAVATDKGDKTDDGPASIAVNFRDVTPPAAPAGLHAVTNGDTVTLTWTANNEIDIDGYNVYRTGTKLNPVMIPASSALSYQDLGLYDYTYVYEVKAVDKDTNESKPSAVKAAVYAPVLDDQKSPTSQRTVRLTGSKAASAALVELFSPASGGAVVATTSADAGGRYQFDVALADGQNSYATRATDSAGNVSRISDAIFVSYAQGPAAPTGLVASEIPEGGALRLTWDTTAGSPAGYNLYRSDTEGGLYGRLNSDLLSNREYDDAGLTNGKSYYYVVTAVDTQNVEGEYSLWAAGVPRDTIAPEKPVITLPTWPGAVLTVYNAAVTIAGYAEPNALVEMFRNGVSQGKTSASGLPVVLTNQFPDVLDSVALSPDEQVVAYSIWNGELPTLWFRTINAVDEKLITLNGNMPVWSPNGDKLLYLSWDQNWNEMIWVYTVASGTATPLTGETDIDEYEPVWSPDGTKIAFTSNRLTGDYSVWMKDLADGALKQISSGPDASNPSFSPDGKKLAYYDSGQAAVFDVAGGGSQVIESDSDWRAISWSPDSKELSAISYRNGYGDVYVYTLATGTSVQVTHLDNDYDSYGNAVWSADGTRLVIRKWVDALYSNALEIVPVHAIGGIKVVQSGINPVYLDRTDSGAIVYAEGSVLHRLGLNGKYEFKDVQLEAGENIFWVVAADASGNTSEQSDPITLIYDDSRMPDLVASSADVYLYPPMPIAGEQMAVNAAVWNKGATDAYDVDVLVYLWNAQNELELLKTERIPFIASQSAELVSAAWDSTGKAGANRIVVVVDVDDRIVERDETNNMAIKDFFVADHEGIALTVALDAAAYGSNKNVALTITARNSGPVKNTVLETRIEDGNGYPVVTFNPRTITMNYASESVQSYSWNTGATFAATYSVRTLLKEGTTVLADSTVPLVILPDSATRALLVTDKAVYGANEPVTIAATIGNEGRNWIIPSLRSQLTVKDAAGGVLWSEEKTFSNLLPGSELSHAAAWNTGLNTAGNYMATLELTSEGTTTTIRTAAFTIRDSAVVTGTLSIAPDVASFGGSFQAAYTLANNGNADTGLFLVEIMVIDPDTLAVMGSHEEQIAVTRGGSLSGQAVFSTVSYGLKKYTILLRSVDGNITAVLASASMTVKDMTPPIMTVLSPVAGTPNTTTVQFLVSASDDASGVERIEYSRDGGSWSLLPISDPSLGRFGTTWEPTMADNGMHMVSFRAVDRAGNQSEETTISYEIRINRAPTAPSPAWPASGQDVETVRPEIAVNNASDPNGDSLSYVFELYGDNDLTTRIVPPGVVPEGTGTTAWTVPADLTENAVYYWRAQAYDGKLYGPWTNTASFRVNAVEDPPSAPIPTSPQDKTEVATTTPILTVINAVDPDDTSLTYNFQVALEPAFVTTVTSTVGVVGGAGNTSWQVSVPLAEDVRYYWRSQADDWNVTGNWSNPVEFFVNTGNNRPTDPSIIAPADKSEVTSTSSDIELQNSIDPDSPIITYSIELDTVKTFDSPALLRSGPVPQGQTTMWHVDGLLDNTGYFVRAKASDGAAESNWSAVTGFFVNTSNDAPSTPIPANPSNGAGVNVFTPTLSVQNATDIDRDTLTYEFEVYDDPALTAPALASVAGVVETQGSTSWTVSATLQENRTYYWRAQAFDGALASGWTTTLSFTVNTGDEPPYAPQIISPAEGGSVDSTMPTLTVLNAIDPDSARLIYDFEVLYGSTLIWTATGIAEGTAGSTSATLNVALNDNTKYFWRCRANDGQQGGTWTAMTGFTVHLPQTGITVDIEVEPETLSQKSKGNWVMVEIELPHGYRTEDVDISSIRLEGTVPAVAWPHEKKKRHHDHGCDHDHREHEHGELKVKFRRSDVIAVLPAGNHVPVHVTGTVAGTSFEGVDIIRVIH